ncbi:hypothetical protein RJ640_016933 [Escallonia rubra]|uniref:Uncharacterized protein n=1 Tax=Escallonia rubra TaxID=112253 RepID=A0AA88UNL4_9ASTE|nr:hypothetical protein RJ640_016933 [Escallonia rubra]
MAIWDEIDRCESYLVCCMFDEATSLASSVVRRLRETETASEGALEGSEYNDMLESAGMVLVQSLKRLGRTKDILKDLKLLFGSVTAIPVQVFLTGSSIQHDMNKATQQKPEQTGYGNGEVRAVNLEVRIFLVMVTAGLVSDLVSKGASAPRVMLQESGCLGQGLMECAIEEADSRPGALLIRAGARCLAVMGLGLSRKLFD